MTNRYIVTLRTEVVTEVEVEADSEDDASREAMSLIASDFEVESITELGRRA